MKYYEFLFVLYSLQILLEDGKTDAARELIEKLIKLIETEQ